MSQPQRGSGGGWLAWAALAAAALGLLSSAVVAQDVFPISHPCIAWWAVDPAGAGSTVPPRPERLAEAVSRYATADDVVGANAPALAAAVLAASLECGVPNRIVLLDIAPDPGGDTPVLDGTRLRMVVEVVGDSDAFERAVRAAAGKEGNVIEGPLALEGDGPVAMGGVWFQTGRPPKTRRVEVAAGGGRVLVGLGDGVLADWLREGNVPGVIANLQRTARGQEGGHLALEVFVDLDRLRAATPEKFSQSLIGRELEVLGLANARAFSLGVAGQGGAEQVPPVAVSWAARSEPLDRAIGVPVAGSEWLQAGAGWGCSIGVHVNVRAFTNRLLAAARAWRTRFGMMEFDRAIERWSKSEKGRQGLGVLALETADVHLGVAADGLLRLQARLPGASSEGVAALVGSLPGAVEKEAGRWEVIILDAQEDPGGILRRIEVRATAESDAMVVEASVVRP